jgi:hypothetical protein
MVPVIETRTCGIDPWPIPLPPLSDCHAVPVQRLTTIAPSNASPDVIVIAASALRSVMVCLRGAAKDLSSVQILTTC